MTRKSGITAALAMLVIASLACSFEREAAAVEAGVNQVSTQVPGPIVPKEVQEAQPPQQPEVPAVVSTSDCQVEDWQLIPVGFSLGAPRDGWRIALVELAVVNNSQVWGQLTVMRGGATLKTEDGSVYEVLNGTVGPQGAYPFPEFPWEYPEPYAALLVEETGGIASKVMPPGFAMRGVYEPIYLPLYQFHLAFLVAEEHERFTLGITQAGVTCWVGGEQTGEAILPFEFILGEEHPLPYPTTGKFRGIFSPVELGNLGTLQFRSAQRGPFTDVEDGVGLVFNLSNPNKGYQDQGVLSAYLVGDDGIAYPGIGGKYEIGPGRTGDISWDFQVPVDVDGLRLVLYDLESVWEVFDLPPEMGAR